MLFSFVFEKKDWEYNNGKVELLFQFFLKLWHATQKVGFFWCYWKRQTHVLAFLNPYTILYLSTVSWWPLHDLWKTLFLHELWINPNRNVKRLSNLLINSYFSHLREVIYAIASLINPTLYISMYCKFVIHKISQYLVKYWYHKNSINFRKPGIVKLKIGFWKQIGWHPQTLQYTYTMVSF